MGFAARDVRNRRSPMEETETDDRSHTSAPAGANAGGVDELLVAVRYERASRLEPGAACAAVRDTEALLLRGFSATTAMDFVRAIDTFGYEEMPYVRGAAPRTNVVGRVFTTNESPPDQKTMPLHHEMAQAPTFPSKLFFCEVEPKSGEGTPIVLSHYVYKGGETGEGWTDIYKRSRRG